MKNKNLKLKKIALLEELESSNNLINYGLGELQQIHIENDFYFLPFQLLSQGFERFMKAYFCIANFNEKEKFPKKSELKSLGHRLDDILIKITEDYYYEFQSSQYSKDLSFLTKDEKLKKGLEILSKFGDQSRYYNFNLITGSANKKNDTRLEWEKFENRFMNKREFKNLGNIKMMADIFDSINRRIVVVFEKFIAALSRQFMFGCLGGLGRQLTAFNAVDFGKLYEGDYGKRSYKAL